MTGTEVSEVGDEAEEKEENAEVGVDLTVIWAMLPLHKSPWRREGTTSTPR